MAGLCAEKNPLEELKSVEATLPDDVRPLYDRLIAMGHDVAGVKGCICSAYTEITSQCSANSDVEMFILCKNCGRCIWKT